LGGVFSTLTSLAKQLRSAAMRLFRCLVFAKNTLAERTSYFANVTKQKQEHHESIHPSTNPQNHPSCF
jgi:hypothetical protein